MNEWDDADDVESDDIDPYDDDNEYDDEWE